MPHLENSEMQIEVFDQINTKLGAPHELDRGGLFGDGFFTTGVIYQKRFCHQQRHFERLITSANRLLYDGLDFSKLKDQLNQLVYKADHAAIRISISRQQTQRGYAISADANYRCTILLSALPDLPSTNCELIDAQTAISCNPTLAGLKHLNRLDSVLAASEISKANQEVLMYHEGLVISGSKSNLFIKLNGVWQTPQLSYCGIAGITRDRIIEIFKQKNIQWSITDIKRADIANVDAAFVTNSLLGVWPVASINNKVISVEDSDHIRKLITRT